MAITQAVCNSFKRELLEARHNFLLTGGNTFKIAMYPSTPTLDKTITAYNNGGAAAANEITGTNYTAGGNTLTRVDPSLSTDTAITTFANTTWSTSTISNAAGALVYNNTNQDRAVVVLDFGGNKSSSAGDFTITFPTGASSLIRIA